MAVPISPVSQRTKRTKQPRMMISGSSRPRWMRKSMKKTNSRPRPAVATMYGKTLVTVSKQTIAYAMDNSNNSSNNNNNNNKKKKKKRRAYHGVETESWVWTKRNQLKMPRQVAEEARLTSSQTCRRISGHRKRWMIV